MRVRSLEIEEDDRQALSFKVYRVTRDSNNLEIAWDKFHIASFRYKCDADEFIGPTEE